MNLRRGEKQPSSQGAGLFQSRRGAETDKKGQDKEDQEVNSRPLLEKSYPFPNSEGQSVWKNRIRIACSPTPK